MNKDVIGLFVFIDKMFGGDGNLKRIYSDLRKIEKKKVFTRETIWHHKDCNRCLGYTLPEKRSEAIKEARIHLQPDEFCWCCRKTRSFQANNPNSFSYVFDTQENRNIFTDHRVDMLGYNWEDFQDMSSELMNNVLHQDDAPELLYRRTVDMVEDGHLNITYRARDTQGDWQQFDAIEYPISPNNDGSYRYILGFAVSLEPALK